MVVRELFAKLGLDLDKSSFSAGDAAIKGIKLGLVAIGGVAVAAATGLAVAVHGLIETTSSLNDTSAALQISTDALQEIGFAAKLGGSGIEEMRSGLAILNRHLTAAKDGNEEAIKSFAKLHIKIRDQSGALKSADVVLGDVAEAFKKLPDGPEKTAAAMDLFGRSGAGFLAFLSEGRDGLEALRMEARELGAVLDKETIKAGDELGDNLDRLTIIAVAMRNEIGGPLLKQLNEITTAFIEWYKANRALVRQRMDQVAKIVGSAIRGLVTVAKALGKVLFTLIDLWQIIAVIMSSVVIAIILQNIVAIGALIAKYLFLGEVAVASALRSAAAWIVAAAPFVALVALIALAILLVDELITQEEGGLTLIGELGPRLQKFLEDFASGGNMKEPIWIQFLRFGAALMSDLSGTWRQIVEGWKLIFQDFFDWLVETFNKAVEKIPGLRLFIDAHKEAGKFLADVATTTGTVVKRTTVDPLINGLVAGARGVEAGGSAVIRAFTPSAPASSKNTFTTQIYQQPGQDANAVADAVESRLDAWNQARLEEAQAALEAG